MKTRILTIILVLSLVFNVFFALGYFRIERHKRQGRTFHGRTERIAESLNLDQDQYKLFQDIRENKSNQRQAYLAELIKDKPDQKLLKRLSLEGLDNMQKFMRSLRPEQRQLFLEMRSRRIASKPATDAPPDE